MSINLVELLADAEECAFDQPCRFGHRIEGHAVYCHNDNWADSPRKCRRTWYTGGEVKDEDCPGFEVNPEFTGIICPTIVGEPCSKCSGRKLVKTDRGAVETCPLCIGDGVEPGPIPLTPYEQATLESGLTMSGKNPGIGRPFVKAAESSEERQSIYRLEELGLIRHDSTTGVGGACAMLLQLTAKGEAVLKQNWKSAKAKPESST